MKLSTFRVTFKMMLLLIFSTALQTILWAQDNSQSSTTTTSSTHVQTSGDGGAWYTSPWVWIVGGAILILLLLAFTRGNRSAGSSTDKVTVTKTVSKSTDTDAV